jgi:hypothetical protein
VPILFGKHRADRRRATSAGGLTALAVKLSQKKKLGQSHPQLEESSMTGQGRRIGLAGIASETG